MTDYGHLAGCPVVVSWRDATGEEQIAAGEFQGMYFDEAGGEWVEMEQNYMIDVNAPGFQMYVAKEGV